MRRRDIAPKVVEAPPPQEIIRLEKIIEREPSADLTETEAQLRALRSEVKELRQLLAKLPQGKRAPENYRFYPHRGADGLIQHVDGIVLSDTPSLLERAATSVH